MTHSTTDKTNEPGGTQARSRGQALRMLGSILRFLDRASIEFPGWDKPFAFPGKTEMKSIAV